MRAIRFTLVVGCCATLLACSPGAAPPTAPVQPDYAAGQYGQAAPRDPEGVTYQPDVVVIDGGPGAVRSVSADGLLWTIAATAAGVEQLDVGEVAFLTSRAAGRVLTKESAGGDVVLTLAPIQLEEIIRDGHIKIDTIIRPENNAIQQVPDLPGALGVPAESDVDPGPGFVPASTGPAPALPPARQGEAELSIGNFDVNTTASSSGIGLSASTKPGGTVKLGADVKLAFESLRATYDILVTEGQVSNVTTMLVHGIESIEVSLYAGAANGTDDNQKVKIEVPMEIFNEPVVVYGVPMVINVKMKAVFEMALVGRNATVSASGKWHLGGAVGKAGDGPATPHFGVERSILDSIAGISIGPSGMVFGVEFKIMAGVGMPGAAAGPYTKLKIGVGVANGSALGAPLVRCRTATLSIKQGAGVGMSLDAAVLAGLRKSLPSWAKIKTDLEVEKMWTIWEPSETVPKIPLCTGK